MGCGILAVRRRGALVARLPGGVEVHVVRAGEGERLAVGAPQEAGAAEGAARVRPQLGEVAGQSEGSMAEDSDHSRG